MAEMSLNHELYPVKPGSRHISDADAEMLFSQAGADSPDLQAWSAAGGFHNYLWASGLEHLLHYSLSSTCMAGVVVLDNFGWRATGILQNCGHPVEMKFDSDEWAPWYLNNLPIPCRKCEKLMERFSGN